MDLISESDGPTKDRQDFIKASVLFWLFGATGEDHHKNFSINPLSGGRFHMMPLYDVLAMPPTVDA